MTAVAYPDIIQTSHNGRYRAEARSPDNGTIKQRNGNPADTTTFGHRYRQEQRGFRYQLIDTQNSSVIWERWQKESEESPVELCVSNEGWVVIRLHGYASAALILVSRDGSDVVPVAIGPRSANPADDAQAFIADEHVHDTSAGLGWTWGAVRYFFSKNHRPFFCYVTGWGRRIVLDLERGRLVSEPILDTDLEKACTAAERRMVMAYLAEVTEAYEDYDGLELFGRSESKQPYWERWPDLAGHIGLAIRTVSEEALPYLRALEPRSLQQGYTGCHALPKQFQVFTYSVRPLLCLAMRYLGQTPAGYPCCGFFQLDHGTKTLLQVPECVRFRDGKLDSVSASMNARQVLKRVGAPDYLRSFSESQPNRFIWGEHWHYYSGTANSIEELRITWKPGSDGATMIGLERHPMSRKDVHRRIFQAMQM